MLAAEVTLVGRHVPDRAVSMHAVVPVDEASNPALRGGDNGERQARVCRSVLQRSEDQSQWAAMGRVWGRANLRRAADGLWSDFLGDLENIGNLFS